MSDRSHGPLHGIWAVANRELVKWYKVPFIIGMSLVQPILWLALFGKAMNLGNLFTASSLQIPGLSIPSQVINEIGRDVMLKMFGTSDYFSFLAAGMLSFIVLFMSMNSGMTMVWDRRLGILNKLLTTPVPRSNLVIGKALASVIKSLVQATVVLLVAVLLGMQFGAEINPIDFLGTYAALFLLSMGLSSLFLILALRATSWESQMMIMNLVNMPLLFTSNSFYPLQMMPWWLRDVAMVNPITYSNEAARGLLLATPGVNIYLDFAYLLAFAVFFTGLLAVMARRMLSR
ncbi:ABC transporter permease [Conexivisphaera calida]|uniref:ABC transporter, permease protein n=1 Tax=Conexivisphaera calida TaxID=1874277 RepID=A0A4V0P1S3_9ARCH|nr:ABC transporter permease [Conexivisphaera calida]BBE42720.1 ABC transporter, permease protein [Conexivisphaera calida]